MAFGTNKNMDIQILAIVVLYNPDIELLDKNLSAFQQHVDKIILWNNSSDAIATLQINQLAEASSKIIVMHQKENMGISVALNHGWSFAKEHGYNTLLTMDQDSVFHNFSAFKNKVIDIWKKGLLCICGPICTPKTACKTYDDFIEKKHIITSGMLVPIELLNKVGGYCEDFFVDGIDIELCVKARKYNYKSLIYRGAYLTQIYGIPQSKRILGKTIHSAGYPPNRLREIFRNHIIIYKKYRYPFDILIHILYLYVLGFAIKGVLLIENNKKEKLKAICQGIKDGLSAKI